jgi:hypothetical protein
MTTESGWCRVLRRCAAAVAAGLVLMLGMAAPAQADSCGRENERPCNVNERIPSCDLNLVEGSTGRCMRVDCGAENQRSCGLGRVVLDIVTKTPTPLACDVNLKPDGGVCVHPPCGREGQAPCTVFVRVPSCDANLMEEAGRCVHPPHCGREGQAPCPPTMRRTAFSRCDVNLIPRNDQCVRPGVPDGTSTASGGSHGAVPPTQSGQPAATTAPPPSRPPVSNVPPPPSTTAVAAAGAMEADTDRMGNDVYGFPLAQADPASCQSACTVNAQCMAWTFVKAGIRGPQAQCFLKNAAPAPTRNACCVSGAKATAAGTAKSGGLLKPMR